MIRSMQKIDRILDWAAAVDNRAAVPDHETHFAEWTERAAAFRASTPPQTHAYGPAEREVFDLWHPGGTATGLVIFLHGGWWMNFDKSYFSHLAAGPLANGWAVAIPSYTLAPAISLTALTEQARRAVAAVAAKVSDGPLVLSGHSAGGHLVAMAGVAGAMDPALHTRLTRIVSISGVHDLRPLCAIGVGEALRLSEAEARDLSPALLRPAGEADVVAWVGAEETPEFRRQNALLAVAWGGYTATRIVEAPGLNHFNVIAPLAEADSALTRAIVG